MRWLNRHKFLPFLARLPQQNRASVGRDALVGLVAPFWRCRNPSLTH